MVGDWYNAEKLGQMSYYNMVTFEEWWPFMGGANVPTLNALLGPYGISLGQGVYQGQLMLESQKIEVQSGSEIIRFPRGGYLLSAELKVQVSVDPKVKVGKKQTVPVIGILDGLQNKPKAGTIVVMTDSNCLSGQKSIRACHNLLQHFIEIATRDRE